METMRRSAPLAVSILIVVLFSLVILRLAWVMVGQGEQLAAEAAEQQTRSLAFSYTHLAAQKLFYRLPFGGVCGQKIVGTTGSVYDLSLIHI